jgi:hypothetical protein
MMHVTKKVDEANNTHSDGMHAPHVPSHSFRFYSYNRQSGFRLPLLLSCQTLPLLLSLPLKKKKASPPQRELLELLRRWETSHHTKLPESVAMAKRDTLTACVCVLLNGSCEGKISY